MSDKLTISFEPPQSGWLFVRIQAGNAAVSLCASYIPNDFIAELIAATSGVRSLQGTFQATAYEEPEEVILRLARSGEKVVLSLHRCPDSQPLFTFAGSVAAVVIPIWRALRSLETSSQLAEWQRPFPTDQMARLTEAIQHLKPPSA